MGKYITEAYLVLRIKEVNMAAWMKMYLISTGIFLCIDAIWLGFIARGIYAKYLGYIMAKNIVWWAAGVFYLIFMAGLLFFVTVIDLIWGAFVASSTSVLSHMLINRFM